MPNHRALPALLLGLGLSALIVGGCNAPTDSGSNPNTRTESWTVQLDQDRAADRPGRIWFLVDVTLRDDSARGGCAGSTVTTGLGDFSSPRGRIQNVATTGTFTLSWTRGSGACDAFDMTLSPRGQEDFVLSGQSHIDPLLHPVQQGFGIMPEKTPFIAGTWLSATSGGHFFAYPATLSYLPDSHFDAEIDVAEHGCDFVFCNLPSRPAAELCFGPAPAASCLVPLNQSMEWAHDTTIRFSWPRNTTRMDDRVDLYLTEITTAGGPDDQTTCLRPAEGSDLVTVQVESGITRPIVRCASGWTTFGSFRVVAGDGQIGPTAHPLPVPLQVELLDGANNPVANTAVSWTAGPAQGSFSPSTSMTDANGIATTVWTLGANPGPDSATATAALPGGAAPSLTFRATATSTTLPRDCGVRGGPGTDHNGITITVDENWIALGNPHRVEGKVTLSGATLTIGPGTLVCFNGRIGSGISGLAGSRVIAIGTATAPILLTAEDTTMPWSNMYVGGDPADTSYFIDTRIEFTESGIMAFQPVILDSTVIRQSNFEALGLIGSSAGSRIFRSRFDTTYSTSGLGGIVVEIAVADVVFTSAVHGSPGVGIRIDPGADNVVFQDCEVAKNAGFGVETTPSVTIHACNIMDNGSDGVTSRSGSTVDATNNWWGDPAGPFGPAGDGVGANVTYTPFLTVPLVLGYAPRIRPRRWVGP